MEYVEDQDVAPLNAILDQLHGRYYGQSCDLKNAEDLGVFLQLSLPKQLLLKSHWVERLGGKEKVDEFGSHDRLANLYQDHESGLRMVYNRNTGQDISEDKEEFNQEGVDSGEEEDEEESSDKENDKS